MKTTVLCGIMLILLVSMLIMGGCSATKPESELQQEGSEIDQIIGVADQNQAEQQNPDEDEVLRLLGITREKTEQPTVKKTSQEDDQFQKELGDLQKKLAEKDSEISRLKTDLSQKDEKISKLESNSARPTSSSYTATGNFREDYQNALAEYNNHNYKLAIQLFEELLARNSTSSLSDNCRYWIGESYYGLGNYNQAIIEFTKVFSFNNSNKMDDAQLKLGLCYWKLGDRERARQELERLLSDYSTSEYVEKARQFLSRLE